MNHSPRRISIVVERTKKEARNTSKHRAGLSGTSIGKKHIDLHLTLVKYLRGNTLELTDIFSSGSMLHLYHFKETNRLSSIPMTTKRVVEGCIRLWYYVPKHGSVVEINSVTVQNHSPIIDCSCDPLRHLHPQIVQPVFFIS